MTITNLTLMHNNSEVEICF